MLEKIKVKVISNGKDGNELEVRFIDSDGTFIGLNEFKYKSKWNIFCEGENIICISRSKVRTKDYFSLPLEDGCIYLKNTTRKAYAYFKDRKYEDLIDKLGVSAILSMNKIEMNNQISEKQKKEIIKEDKYLFINNNDKFKYKVLYTNKSVDELYKEL